MLRYVFQRLFGTYLTEVHEVLTNSFLFCSVLFFDRLWGEPVNLREQHDALEFFNNLVDNLDEGLKALSGDPLFSNILGGSFADQKICKGCPHRYGLFVPWWSFFLYLLMVFQWCFCGVSAHWCFSFCGVFAFRKK